MFTKERMKAALEAMLFVWGRPLAAKDAANALNISEQVCWSWPGNMTKPAGASGSAAWDDPFRWPRTRRTEASSGGSAPR